MVTYRRQSRIQTSSLIGQGFTGHALFNEEQVSNGLPEVSLVEYITSSDYVVDVAENWQSEFLAVGCMVAFSIYLRQRGSAESKPVGAPHAESSISG